jgi:putative transcriptional regulator
MNHIKEILKNQGRSQTWLAEQIGRSYVITTGYCNNKTQPSLNLLRKIADILEVEMRDLSTHYSGNSRLGLVTHGQGLKKHIELDITI